MNTNGKRIEVLGVPGVGKTYVLKSLRRSVTGKVRYLTFRDKIGETKFERQANRLYSAVMDLLPMRMRKGALRRARLRQMRVAESAALVDFVEGHQAFATWLLGAIAAGDASPQQQWLMLDWFNKLFADYRLVAQGGRDNEVVMLDECFAQKAVTLAVQLGFTGEWVREYASRMPLPDLLLLVEAPEPVIRARLAKRGWPGWAMVEDQAGEDRYLQSCAEAVAMVREVCRSRGVPVLSLNNGDGRRADIGEWRRLLKESI